MPGKIFISYRRAEAEGLAGRIYDRLQEHFGKDKIFMDVDNVPPGEDFTHIMQRMLDECDVLLALIGPRWLDAADEDGNRRLENSDDFVRTEIATALKRGIRVIPVLLEGASMPHSRDLLDDLKPLSRRDALEIRHSSFDRDFEKLRAAIKRAPSTVSRPRAAVPRWLWAGLGLVVLLAIAGAIGLSIMRQTTTAPAVAVETAPVEITATSVPGTQTPTRTPRPTNTRTPTHTLRPTNTRTPTRTPRPTNTRIPTRTPQPTTPPLGIGSTQVSPKDGMVMSYIPAGEFQMGGDADDGWAECQKLYEPFIGRTCHRDWFTDEEPVHTVYLDAFWMDQTEVTNAQYAKCVTAGACNPPEERGSYTRDSYYGNSHYDDYPVIFIIWDDAQAYCAWAGRRLPTEAEWEKAARGGLAGKRYPWGDEFDGTQANFCDASCGFDWANPNYNDGYADTAPVGSYAPNGYGLYDVAGNVWEWVADWYDRDYYHNSPTNNPQGPSLGRYRVLRGDSWDFSGNLMLVSNRDKNDASTPSLNLGFRCARSATSP